MILFLWSNITVAQQFPLLFYNHIWDAWPRRRTNPSLIWAWLKRLYTPPHNKTGLGLTFTQCLFKRTRSFNRAVRWEDIQTILYLAAHLCVNLWSSTVLKLALHDSDRSDLLEQTSYVWIVLVGLRKNCLYNHGLTAKTTQEIHCWYNQGHHIQWGYSLFLKWLLS